MPESFGGGFGSGSLVIKTLPAVTVPAAGFTTLATVTNSNTTLLCVQFDVATQALDQFRVSGRVHPDAPYIVFGTPGASWTDRVAVGSNIASGNRILEANANLDTIAAAGNGYFAMDITGLLHILIEASAAVNNASVTLRLSQQ